MRKFYVLLKKELLELITVQNILPLVIVVVMFSFIGTFIEKEMIKTKEKQPVIVLDADNTNSSHSTIEFLNSTFKVTKENDLDVDNAIKKAKTEKINFIIEIPNGYENSIFSGSQTEIKTYTIMKSFNALASGNSATLKAIIETINEYVSNSLITNKIQDVDPQIIKHPIKNSDVVVVGNKQAEVSPDAIINFIAMQTTLIPIILFIVIILAATMIATAIATEKEDKTLETLLTVPVDRKYIVLAKMCGAGIMAFLSAGIYMLGFRNYLNGVVGEGMSSTMTPALKDAVIQLGLTIGAYEYFLLGLSLFLGIMVALAIAMIVGVFAEDVKGAQGLISPLMFLVMIPYMLTMLVDVNSVSSGLKWLIYAIPFSHSFLVAPNLFLRNYSLVYGGILYQAIIFVIFVFIAAKIFSSEKLFTIRLRFGRKNKTKNG